MKQYSGIAIGGPYAGKDIVCDAPNYVVTERIGEAFTPTTGAIKSVFKRTTYRLEYMHIPDHNPICMWVPEGVTLLAAILELFEGYVQNTRHKT